MAIFNEILTGSLSNVLARRLGMQVGSPAPALAPEIMPVLTLESDRPEWKFLAGERMQSVWSNPPAVAAEYSYLAVWNPAGSGSIAVIEQLSADATSARIGVWLRAGSATGTVVNPGVRDSRWAPSINGPFTGALRAARGSNPGLPPEPTLFGNAPGATIASSLPIVLLPGWQLQLVCTTLNTAINSAAVSWRERALVPGEDLRI